jgi:hypothetical protein
MPKKSAANKTVRKSAAQVPPASRTDLERLHAAMQGRIDTTEVPERRKFQRLERDANGRLPPRKSMIREAIAQEMQRLHLTVYRLWLLARAHYPALSQSAVHEFLKEQRQLELPSIEALLAAVNLRVVRGSAARNGRKRLAKTLGAKRKVS